MADAAEQDVDLDLAFARRRSFEPMRLQAAETVIGGVAERFGHGGFS